MTKTLKLEAEKIANGYIVTVVEQSHRGYEFGESGRSSWAAPNGLLLKSTMFPEAILAVEDDYLGVQKGDLVQFYVRGDIGSGDFQRIYLNHGNYARLRSAVAAYNEHFAAPGLTVSEAPRPAPVIEIVA